MRPDVTQIKREEEMYIRITQENVKDFDVEGIMHLSLVSSHFFSFRHLQKQGRKRIKCAPAGEGKGDIRPSLHVSLHLTYPKEL